MITDHKVVSTDSQWCDGSGKPPVITRRDRASRWLADAIAQYVGSFMSCYDNCPDVDWQYMAEDFVESCDVIPELLTLFDGPQLALAATSPARSTESDGEGSVGIPVTPGQAQLNSEGTETQA